MQETKATIVARIEELEHGLGLPAREPKNRIWLLQRRKQALWAFLTHRQGEGRMAVARKPRKG